MNSEKRRVIQLRKKRSLRVRKHMHGTATKPRMSVFKSNRHMSVQLIDDETGHTLASVSTLSKNTELKRSVPSAEKLGVQMAEKAKEKGITNVVFDRGSSKFHGTLAAFANAVREHGVQC